MAGNYASYHAGIDGKMTKGNVQGLENHTFRKTNDVYENHGNDKINKDMTKYNVDYLKDDKPLIEQIEEGIEKRFKGKRAMNKKSVVAREVIIQPSPNHFEGLDIAQRLEMIQRFTDDSMLWFADEFGEDNILGYSIHMDETNPHVHVPVMPMTEDGRMAQKDFFKGPTHLKMQHRTFREHMNKQGWAFETENKQEDAKGVKLTDYKANAKGLERMRDEYTQKLRALASEPQFQSEAMTVMTDMFKDDPKMMADFAQIVKNELKEEYKKDESLKNEVKNELKDDGVLKSEVKQQLIDELKADDELRVDALQQVADQYANDDSVVDIIKAQIEENEKPQIISNLNESLTKALTPMVEANLTRTLEPKLKAELTETYKKDYDKKANVYFDNKYKRMYEEKMAKERAKDKLKVEQFEAQAVADVASSQTKAREVSDSNMAIIDLVETAQFKRAVPNNYRADIVKLAFNGSNIYADMASESNKRRAMRKKAIESQNADDLEL